MQLMRRFWDAAVLLDPAARDLDEGQRFPICQPERLLALWQDAGLVNTAVRVIDIPTVFRDFDDYWMPFLGGQGPAPGYCVSLSEANCANTFEPGYRRRPTGRFRFRPALSRSAGRGPSEGMW
jgi:hypothetical protein